MTHNSPHSSPKQFQPYRRRVNFAETDAAGIVHFTNYLKWAEEAEQNFLRNLGVPLIDRSQSAVKGWPRISIEAQYLRPAFFEDFIQVQCTGLKIKGSRISYQFEILRETETSVEQIANIKMQTVFARIKVNEAGQTELAACLLSDEILRLLEPWQL